LGERGEGEGCLKKLEVFREGGGEERKRVERKENVERGESERPEKD